MDTPTTSSSERGEPAPGRVIVVEGMPGAGKTTAVTFLATQGHTTVGEYATTAGVTIPVHAHPDGTDDDAHQANWLTKHHLTLAARQRGPVIVDRDWISALAYAVSLDDGGQLLRQRAHWASGRLRRSALGVADVYVVLQIDPLTSLARRPGRLAAGHPWSARAGLERLADFYADPVQALQAVSPAVAAHLSRATWHYLADTDPRTITRLLQSLVIAHPVARTR